MITTKQAEQLVPTVRTAVAALHEVWAKCREAERALGRDLDGLEGIVQDMAAGVDDAESVDVDYVRDALNARFRRAEVKETKGGKTVLLRGYFELTEAAKGR